MKNLLDKIETIEQIGKKRKYYFNKLGIFTLKDLLLTFPVKFLKQAKELKEGEILIKVKIVEKIRCNKKVFKVLSSFNNEIVQLIFYNEKQFNIFKLNEFYYISGNLKKNNEYIIESPKIYNKNQITFPIYENLPSYLTQKIINKIIDKIESKTIIYKENTLKDILRNIHNGVKIEESIIALKYLEAQFFKNLFKKQEKLEELNISENDINIPYELTKEQARIIKNLAVNLSKNIPMKYFIYGEVGAGKTIICIAAIQMIINQNYTVVLIAPTVFLAYQHYQEISKIINQSEILLYTSLTKKRKKEIEKIQNGNYKLIISTHAIFFVENIPNIGLIIIDEMHKFGVLQRAGILNQAKRKNLLMLTATPIPRSLAILINKLMIYDTLPSYKPKQIKTTWLNFSNLENLIEKLKDKKSYWVLSNIEDQEKNNEIIIGAKTRFEFLKNRFQNVFILHGKMSDQEKIMTIENFKKEQKAILVATTIIEIGINIPNADVMIIESAERFGLSQLHQLRGRVGRQGQKAYCILISKFLTKKIKYMKQYDNGFEISKKDMEIRGAGKITGTMQHGCESFYFLSENDLEIIESAKDVWLEEFIIFDNLTQSC